MNATLTATGVIATILSVVFAIAAYFVQRKKNNSGRSDKPVPGAANPGEDAHVVTTRRGVSREMKRHEASSEGVAPPPPAAQPQTENQSGGQKQIFRKYTAKGIAESEAVIEDEDEVLWE